MMDVGRHPRIELMTYSKVEAVSGYVGNFKVRIRRKARYVDERECTACGECVSACPVVRPDEYQMGFSSRRAIYIPFPQAIPSAYIINMEECLGYTPIACGKCLEACDKKCIDFDMQDQVVDIEVGAIVVATGLDVYDPAPLDEYGYTRYENVITSLEFERLICAGGPTEGHFIRPSDGARPRRIGFIQCVGSRCASSGERGQSYCSNVCCMNTVKDSLLLKDHYPDTEITVFYLDIRAFGKGFEDLYRRSKEVGVRYVRGLPGEVVEDPATGNLILTVENTTARRLERHELDLVVLSVGLIPREDRTIKRLLALSTTSDGFYLESHPKLKPVDAPTRGVFFAGCAEAPKDIKESVTQASAAAARAQIVLNADRIRVEAITAVVDEAKCTACGLCARVCPYGAITVDPKAKVPASVVEAACAGCGTCAAECRFGAIAMRHFTDQQIFAQIEEALAEEPQEKILVFACNWCSYAGADLAGVSRLQYPPNARVVRTMCSGRVDEDFVLRAFELGAPIVLVSGCHFGDCHYIDANHWTQRRMDRMWNRLERLGIRPERLQLEWISAAEGQKFAGVMRELEEMRKKVTREEIEFTRRVLAERKGEEGN
ncbi:MAG TPA: hydrogenase iron-sulfur subunit [Anaerolineae bacterium]|nr:hydrogenase iron-sulfur subunit [Anaerolineae bacterium]